jgi:hypothetical protein
MSLRQNLSASGVRRKRPVSVTTLATAAVLRSTRDRPHPEHWLHNLPESSFRAVSEELATFAMRIRALEHETYLKAGKEDPRAVIAWMHAEALSVVSESVQSGLGLRAVEEFALGVLRAHVRTHSSRYGNEKFADDAFDHHVLVAVEMIKRAAVVG